MYDIGPIFLMVDYMPEYPGIVHTSVPKLLCQWPDCQVYACEREVRQGMKMPYVTLCLKHLALFHSLKTFTAEKIPWQPRRWERGKRIQLVKS